MKFKPMSFVPIGIPVGVLEKLGQRNAGFAPLHQLVANRQTNAERRAIVRAWQLAINQKGKQ